MARHETISHMNKAMGTIKFSMKEGELFIRHAMRPDYEPAHPENDLREFMRLWLSTMPPDQLEKMDSAIVDYFGIAESVPIDTALHQMRDMVNRAIGKHIYIQATVKNGTLERTTFIEWVDDQRVWYDALSAVINKRNFRVCEWCGNPFPYKREHARLCSNACRIKSSRAKTG